jgi:chromosome segregation ATPase
LKTQVKEGESDTVTQRRKNVEDLQTERKTIAGQIAELRESRERLEAQDEELFAKQESIQSEIDAECESESKEAGRLNSELQEATKQMKGDERIRCLVDMLKTFDDSLAARSVQTVSQGESAEEHASKMMDIYLLRARNYFMYESSCYQVLQSRIKASQNEVSALVSYNVFQIAVAGHLCHKLF